MRPFRAFLCAMALLGAGPALAADLVVSWTNPTTNSAASGGGAIPATGPGSLTGTRVEWGTCSGTAFGTKAGEVMAPAGATTITIADVAPATWCVRAFARNTYGSESAASNVASKIVPTPVPNPPVLTTIAVVAYELRMYSNGTLRFVQVGTVPLGAECGSRLAGDYAVFDGAKITSPLRGGIIAARCSAVTANG